MSAAFTDRFTASHEDIDVLGHVNNAVWVGWIQEMAGRHWHATARPEDIAAYVWVVVRHEIDYHGNLTVGQSVEARTWVGEPRGARFDRYVEFVREARVLVRAKTTWAIVEQATGRIRRVPPELAAPFLR